MMTSIPTKSAPTSSGAQVAILWPTGPVTISTDRPITRALATRIARQVRAELPRRQAS